MSSDKITQYSDSEYPEDESKGNSDPNRRMGRHSNAANSSEEGLGVGNLPFRSSSSSVTSNQSFLQSTSVNSEDIHASGSHLGGFSADSTFSNNANSGLMGTHTSATPLNSSDFVGDNHLNPAHPSPINSNSSTGVDDLHTISDIYSNGVASEARSVGKHGIDNSSNNGGNSSESLSSYKEEPLSMANLLDSFSALSTDKNPFKLDDSHGVSDSATNATATGVGSSLGVTSGAGSTSNTGAAATNTASSSVINGRSNNTFSPNGDFASKSIPINKPVNDRVALFSDSSSHFDVNAGSSDAADSGVTVEKTQANTEAPQDADEIRSTRVYQPIKDYEKSDNYNPADKGAFGGSATAPNSAYDTKDFAKEDTRYGSKGSPKEAGNQAPSYVPDRTQVLSSRDMRSYKTAQDGEATGEIPVSAMSSMNRNISSDKKASRRSRKQEMAENKPKVSVALSVFEIMGEILLTAAVFLAFYILWQLWWTGVISQHVQQAQVAQAQWVQPKEQNGSYQIAQPQPGPPPVLPAPTEIGELIGQVYIPRFGAEWHRNLVQGTSLEQLARHGLCHYVESQMPGAIGNFAIAGHRSGYGEPLGNVNELQKGDAVIVRTKDYWYVYEDTGYEIVLPSQIGVIYPVPNKPDATPTERLITLTTCTPRYTNATHRWIVYGKMKYWAKVADGIPEQLATPGGNGKILFTQAGSTWTSKIPPLTNILVWLLIAYAIFFISGAAAWRWPGFKKKYRKGKDNITASMYGFLYRVQPGIAVIRWIELILIFCIVVVCLFQWVYPSMAENIPYLRVTSNYVGVGE